MDHLMKTTENTKPYSRHIGSILFIVSPMLLPICYMSVRANKSVMNWDMIFSSALFFVYVGALLKDRQRSSVS